MNTKIETLDEIIKANERWVKKKATLDRSRGGKAHPWKAPGKNKNKQIWQMR